MATSSTNHTARQQVRLHTLTILGHAVNDLRLRYHAAIEERDALIAEMVQENAEVHAVAQAAGVGDNAVYQLMRRRAIARGERKR